MQSFLLFILCSGLAALIWAVAIEPSLFRVRIFQFKHPKPLKRPYKILHLSDIHFAGPHRKLSHFFEKLALETYDFIFLTGDIFDCDEGAPHGTNELKKLKARHGMFAVWGNHDYYDYKFRDVFMQFNKYPATLNKLDVLEKALTDAGVRLLKNETIEVSTGHDIFLIHGLDDHVTQHAEFDKIVPKIHPEKHNLLLTHTIDVFLHLPEGKMDISFSGPISTHTRFGADYARGMRPLKGTACVVSQGMGTSRFFKFRFWCPPEAVVLEINP